MGETPEGHVRRMEAHMKESGQWPDEAAAQESLRTWLKAQFAAWKAKVNPHTPLERELLSAMRAAHDDMMARGMEDSRGYRVVRDALLRHDPKPPPDREQMALWTEPWGD
jgi:hypothetical protein